MVGVEESWYHGGNLLCSMTESSSMHSGGVLSTERLLSLFMNWELGSTNDDFSLYFAQYFRILREVGALPSSFDGSGGGGLVFFIKYIGQAYGGRFWGPRLFSFLKVSTRWNCRRAGKVEAMDQLGGQRYLGKGDSLLLQDDRVSNTVHYPTLCIVFEGMNHRHGAYS